MQRCPTLNCNEIRDLVNALGGLVKILRTGLVHFEFSQPSCGGGPGAKPRRAGRGGCAPTNMTKRETAHALYEHEPSIE